MSYDHMLLRIQTCTPRPTLLTEKQTYLLKSTWDQTPTWEHTHITSLWTMLSLSLSLSHKNTRGPSLLHCFLQSTCLLHIQHHWLCYSTLSLSLSLSLLFQLWSFLFISLLLLSPFLHSLYLTLATSICCFFFFFDLILLGETCFYFLSLFGLIIYISLQP
jgi:hypothetical protein